MSPYHWGVHQRSKGRSRAYFPVPWSVSVRVSALPGLDSDSKSATDQWNHRMQNSLMVRPWVTIRTLGGWRGSSKLRQRLSRKAPTRS